MNNQLVEVTFRNQSVQAVQHNGTVFVAMRPISENIGLEWSGQQKKLAKQGGKFSCVHIPTTGSDGKRYKMLCIPLRKLNGWLFSVNPEKVRPEIKDNLIAYQEECFEVLHDHFTKGEAARERGQESAPATQAEIDAYYAIAANEQAQHIRKIWDKELAPLLKSIKSPLLGRLNGRILEIHITTRRVRDSLSEKLPDGAIPRIF